MIGIRSNSKMVLDMMVAISFELDKVILQSGSRLCLAGSVI